MLKLSGPTTLLVLLLGAATGWACYPPFVTVGDGCYYIETSRGMSWTNAREFCESLGGDGGVTATLAVFPSCDAFIDFTGYMGFNAPADSTFWIGAHTEFGTSSWRWLTGEPLASGVPFWAYEQGHDSDEDCAAMDSSSYFQLSDFACADERYFVCYLPTDSQRHDTRDDPPVILDCPKESIQVGDYCYWFSDSLKSWSTSENYCRTHFSSNRGELFSPSSCDEFTKMAHHLEVTERDKSHWVGASDATENQEWAWVSGDMVPGGAPFWATSEPNDHELRYYCGLMGNEKRFYLEDEKCSAAHYFICKLHVANSN